MNRAIYALLLVACRANGQTAQSAPTPEFSPNGFGYSGTGLEYADPNHKPIQTYGNPIQRFQSACPVPTKDGLCYWSAAPQPAGEIQSPLSRILWLSVAAIAIACALSCGLLLLLLIVDWRRRPSSSE